MFDFPQPGEIYRSAGFPDVAVVGILEDGIPWEMPYRCPDIVWKQMKTPLPPVLRAALYRRAVACAWLTVCERQHRYPHLTLESLEAAIAAELEGFYLRQHGEE
ncbi:hypothetical protein PU66_24680, partial [Escherichia coli]